MNFGEGFCWGKILVNFFSWFTPTITGRVLFLRRSLLSSLTPQHAFPDRTSAEEDEEWEGDPPLIALTIYRSLRPPAATPAVPDRIFFLSRRPVHCGLCLPPAHADLCMWQWCSKMRSRERMHAPAHHTIRVYSCKFSHTCGSCCGAAMTAIPSCYGHRRACSHTPR